MNIDDILKGPAVAVGKKRRMPDNPTPDVLKKMRTTTLPSASLSTSHPGTNGKGRFTPRVEEETDGSRDVEMADFAPGNDADYFAEEDDEGRFFGGGLTGEQKQILNIFDENAKDGVMEDVEEMTAAGVKRLTARLERATTKNQIQRSKYPNDPMKFIDSEMDVDNALRALMPLSQYPKVSYPILVSSGAATLLAGLLTHENADIMIATVEVIQELTDEDVGNEEEVDEEDEEGQKEAALKLLIDCFMKNAILELLADNLPRLNEVEESDRQGVYRILGVLENLLAYNPAIAVQLIKTSILSWLLQRIQAKEHDGNRSYSAELLSIIVQDERETRLAVGKADGVDALLRVLSQFRKREPDDADEGEFMDNLFDALSAVLSEPENRKAFLDGEGIELMLIMIERPELIVRCLKVLDHSMTGPAGESCCEQFVEALGLKHLFTTFMGRRTKKAKARKLTSLSEETGHILGIISSLLTNLASESDPRVRLLLKFVEEDYEKCDKLLELRDHAVNRLKVADKAIASETQQMKDAGEEIDEIDKDRWYLQRLEGGLYTLNAIDYILGWICMEDDGVCAHVQQMLKRKSASIKDIVERLKTMHDDISDDGPQPDAGSDALSQKDILSGLIAYLREL